MFLMLIKNSLGKKGLFVHRKWDSFPFLVFLYLTVCVFYFLFIAFQWFPKFNSIITNKYNGHYLALWDGLYLLLLHGLHVFRLALSVVFHDHHGSIDFAHGQVCGCWKNDKLPCKIRPQWDVTLSHGGNGSGGQETDSQITDTKKFTITCRKHQQLSQCCFIPIVKAYGSKWRI